MPLLLPNLRQFVSDNALRILARRDLDPMLETLIDDCVGPGSDVDAVRQQVSAYAWEHYADLDPLEAGRPEHHGVPAAPAGRRSPVRRWRLTNSLYPR